MAAWSMPAERRMWEKVLAHAEADGNAEGVDAAQRALGESPQVPELDAL